MSLTPEQKHPVDIELNTKKRTLSITWADGYISRFTLNQLRKSCPCATCNEIRANADPLRLFQPDQAVTEGRLRDQQPVAMVGNYALQFFWQDGHNTGIYTFGFLRQLPSS